jgi:flagellar FliJ protein
MTRHRDPMRSVARVRRVRERDSLLGLLQARREADVAHERHTAVVVRLTHDTATALVPADPAAYAASRLALTELERHGTELRGADESAGLIAAAAQAHWQHDRVRLEAIEMLLERRAAARRAERGRHEAREQDEIALQTWGRRSGA